MHALRKYVQHQMDDRGWRPADLVTASGISKQVISGLLADPRDHIDRMPTEKTIAGLCRAFSIQRPVLLAVIGEAMGLPVSRPVEVADPSRVSNDELIRELARRLEKAGGEHDQRSAPMNQAGTQPAQDQTRETPPVRPERERLTGDESNVHTAGRGDSDAGPSKLERLRQLQDEARSLTGRDAAETASSADEAPVVRLPPPGMPNGAAALLGRDALRDLGIDPDQRAARPGTPDRAKRDEAGEESQDPGGAGPA